MLNSVKMQIDEEIKTRGQILALSLRLEDMITKIIYSTLKPKKDEGELLKIYLDEMILPLQFSKKIGLIKKIIKTDIYKEKIEKYLQTKPSVLTRDNIKNVDDFIQYLCRKFSKILETRNIIAHGMEITDLANQVLELNKGELVLANKLKATKFDLEKLKSESENILKMGWIMLKISNI